MRLARTLQHLLPLILLAVGYLELGALVPVTFDTLGLAGTASLLGPSSFLPLSLAVVWAAFLPPTGFALFIKVVTAVGAAGFAGARAVLTVVWWRDAGELGWSTGILALSGLLLGVSLAAWAMVDARATRNALSVSRTPVEAALSPHTEPVQPGSPTTPTRSPSSFASGNAVAAHGPAVAPVWQSVSTPWPRRDESDPDGTLIRPPIGRRKLH